MNDTLVKELKNDAVIDIKVNKTYYLMTKALSLYLFNQIKNEDKEAYIKSISTTKYEDMDDLQRSFYTVALLLAEIEKVAVEQKLYIEKTIEELKQEFNSNQD